jgi:hypothetical protein
MGTFKYQSLLKLIVEETQRIEEAIKNSLSKGPKRAKEIVQEVSRTTGKKESTIFYWLKKLRGLGKVQKLIGGKYQWVEVEEAGKEEVRFCLNMLEKGTPQQVEEAKEDFLQLSRTKKIGHFPEVRSFLKEAVREYRGKELEWALLVLSFVARLSKAARDMRTLNWIREQKENLLELAKSEKLDDGIREKAIWILDEILEGEDHLKDFWDLLETSLRKADKSRSFPDRIWKHHLLRKHFPERKMEMRRRLYDLLESKEESVRELASQYLDELRLMEYRLPEEGEKREVSKEGPTGGKEK